MHVQTRKSAVGSIIVGCFVALFMLFTVGAAGAYTITVAQSLHGAIKPIGTSGAVTVAAGAAKIFTVIPAAHYHIVDVLVDGESVLSSPNLTQSGRKAIYTFSNVAADHSITATFAIDTVTLAISKSGDGTGTVTAEGINCGSSCSHVYDYGTAVVMTLTPDTGSVFKKWTSAGTQKLTDTTYQIKMLGNRSINAQFLKTYMLTIAKDGEGAGTVKAKGIDCGTDCSESYLSGKIVTLKATPDTASRIAAWSTGTTGKTVKVTMNADKTITATFSPKSQGVKIAEKVSIVDTNASAGIKPLSFGPPPVGTPDFPATSDFAKDITAVYVNERSAEAFKTVNEILCMIAQTRYDAMLNKGNYKAQVDQNLCRSDRDDPASAGEGSQNQSSGSTAPNYMMWTVNSARASDSAPQIVKAWIHEPAQEGDKKGGGAGMTIFAKLTITQGTSETNPYGLFTMSFKMFPEINGTPGTNMIGKGFIKTELDSASGKVLLKFAQNEEFATEEGTESGSQLVTLDRSTDGSSGGGTTQVTRNAPYLPQPVLEAYDFAYNPYNFLRMNQSDQAVCTDRTQFDETAWRYGLYNADGSRVNRNSGFSIKATQGGKDYYGSIGYYGIWFPKDVTLNNGDQVYKMDYGSGAGTAEAYNVLISGGKLKKHVRKLMQLGDVKNVPLDFWDNVSEKSYRAVWNGTNFVKTEWLDQSSGESFWQKLDPDDPSNIYSLSNLSYDMLNFWSQSLGGNVQIKLTCTASAPGGEGPYTPSFSCSAADTLPVVFYSESIVFPSDTVPSSLACFTNCPDTTKIAAENANPFNDYGQPQDSAGVLQYTSYTFDPTQMLLKQNGTSVLATNDMYQYGVMSGPLFELNSDNLALLACDWDNTKICGWHAWNELPEFYTWETGPNSWNQFTALKSGSTILKFDPPLQVSYLHNWGDTTTSTFNLEYSGFGNLWGIPGKCIDWDSGEEITCGPNTRWIPKFSIAEGSEVADVANGTTKYYVKPLEKEQRMKQLDTSACSALQLVTYNLPDISAWTDPGIGNEPTVTGAPAVIGGVLQ